MARMTQERNQATGSTRVDLLPGQHCQSAGHWHESGQPARGQPAIRLRSRDVVSREPFTRGGRVRLGGRSGNCCRNRWAGLAMVE